MLWCFRAVIIKTVYLPELPKSKSIDFRAFWMRRRDWSSALLDLRTSHRCFVKGCTGYGFSSASPTNFAWRCIKHCTVSHPLTFERYSLLSHGMPLLLVSGLPIDLKRMPRWHARECAVTTASVDSLLPVPVLGTPSRWTLALRPHSRRSSANSRLNCFWDLTSDADAVKLSTTFLNSVLPVQRPRIVT